MRDLNYKGLGVLFLCILCIVSMFNSCSNQKSIANVVRQDTFLVPKQYRPSTLQAKQQPIEQPKIPLKLPTEEQKVFNKKLNYVLDNAGHSFENIDLIRADISDLKSLIIDRAVYLRSSNDSLTRVVNELKTQQLAEALYQRKQEEKRDKDQVEAKVRDDINDKIMKYGLIIVIFFSVLTFVVSLLSRRNIKLTPQT